MKKTTLKLWMLLAVALYIVSCTDINDSPVVVYGPLDEELANTKIFTEIKENPDASAMKRKDELNYLSQYSMFIQQPVNHNQPDGDKFKQKVCILFRGYDRPTIMVTEGYLWTDFRDIEDIGKNLNANMVHVEHRNFGESFNQDKGKWEYETGAQASADLHAVYRALKPLFRGKWMSAGTSKNGETSMDYAYYYPNDMDLASAFCSPFNISITDKRFGEYLFTEVSTEELRNIMTDCLRLVLKDGEEGYYQSICDMFKNKGLPVPTFAEYVFNCFDTFFCLFQYTLPNTLQEKMEDITKDKESLVEAIYKATLDNRDLDIYTYFVDCAKEQGFPDPGYDYFSDVLEGTGFKSEDVLPAELHEEDRWVVNHYDASSRIEMCDKFFINSTKPLLLYYSKDDPWTAGQPEKIGPNVKKIINPVGVHSSKINNPDYCPADVKKEVMDYISTYIY